MRESWVGLVFAAACSGACAQSNSGTGGETHWLSNCSSDADCNSVTACNRGVCVPRRTPLASTYDAVDAGGAPTERTVLPPPETVIPNAEAALAGTWVADAASNGECAALFGIDCPEIVFRATGNGGVTGKLTWPPGARPAGPFAAAVNPDSGWPTELSPSAYATLWRGPASGVPYTAFDGKLSELTPAAKLSFFVSMLELWEGWCELQTPHPVEFHGIRKYSCVPQNADVSNTDLGKLTLCTDYQDANLCAVQDGSSESCSCVDPATRTVDPTLPLCSQAFCECSASACRAAVRTVALPFHFDLGSGELTGTISPQSGDQKNVHFVRRAP